MIKKTGKSTLRTFFSVRTIPNLYEAEPADPLLRLKLGRRSLSFTASLVIATTGNMINLHLLHNQNVMYIKYFTGKNICVENVIMHFSFIFSFFSSFPTPIWSFFAATWILLAVYYLFQLIYVEIKKIDRFALFISQFLKRITIVVLTLFLDSNHLRQSTNMYEVQYYTKLGSISLYSSRQVHHYWPTYSQ